MVNNFVLGVLQLLEWAKHKTVPTNLKTTQYIIDELKHFSEIFQLLQQILQHFSE